jgi:putative transposase
MPRKARIDAPGALHHIIIRGIEKKAIFRDGHDKDKFVERLGGILLDTSTPCYAWTLMPNHAHLLLRTGFSPLATVMRRLLTGYAQHFNRRYNRHGQLFQNRYKSILCEEDPYLLELVRYIHLNPLRAGIVKEIDELRSYQHSGHGVLMGTLSHDWQDRDYVLRHFGNKTGPARSNYQSFVAEGIKQGRRPELVGGGLIRSVGGWASLIGNHREGLRVKGDERILGSSDFVLEALKKSGEEFEKSTLLKKQGIDFEVLLTKVAKYYDIDIDELRSSTKQRGIVNARSVLCCLAVRKLKVSCIAVSKKLNISPAAVSKSVSRGKAILSRIKVEDEILES